jgi:hydroxymethylpyrimidine pyrophosphatase-like HAD family hydrolase
MRYRALATDYDGTIATNGRLPAATRAALLRWRESGRALLLVTGRELNDLKRVCPELDLFDRVVVENGAVLHRPLTGETVLLCEPVADELLLALRRRAGIPFGSGRAILATSRTHADAVLRLAAELGVGVSLSYNKSSVMILPAGIDKATGMKAALAEVGVSPDATVGVGDAENDLAFMAACGLAVAVANALPDVRSSAGRTTQAAEGDGVVELVEGLLASDP